MTDLLRAIGNTPLLRLARLPGPEVAEVCVKLEGANPTGSMKDRMAPRADPLIGETDEGRDVMREPGVLAPLSGPPPVPPTG